MNVFAQRVRKVSRCKIALDGTKERKILINEKGVGKSGGSLNMPTINRILQDALDLDSGVCVHHKLRETWFVLIDLIKHIQSEEEKKCSGPS